MSTRKSSGSPRRWPAHRDPPPPSEPVKTGPDPRTILANERTFLSWLRTGVGLMGFGFVVAKFGLYLRLAAHARLGPNRLGLIMVGGGILFIVAGAAHYHRVVARLDRGLPILHSRVPTVMGILMAVAGVAVFFYLLKTA